ncbi:hypothetical protein BS47DRAFT_1324747 [Hydnum rufescens UP504]|uniref:Copper homeostasis protein cutC homolog n=1 Tax=Hydnum rufescens UP504 TaxID=1448309 RepID=A0A9P6B7H4_9AGAM|nr:hypothetical protein BS47DRAFT_1324747 [Hydnum rufescens UP504]
MLSFASQGTSYQITLEICVDSLESAISAVSNGADRLEICGSLMSGGGVTPSVGLVHSIRHKYATIPIHVLIRPRIGRFVYTPEEVSVMLLDIEHLKPMVDGFVIGALTEHHQIDVEVTTRLTQKAFPRAVTFHRAFDVTSDPDQALRDVYGIQGITRILTSGQAPKADSAIPTLSRLLGTANILSASGGRPLIILPGSGLNADTLPPVLDTLCPPPANLREIHCSCGAWVDTDVKKDETVPGGAGALALGFGGGDPAERSVWRTQGHEVGQVRKLLDDYARRAF